MKTYESAHDKTYSKTCVISTDIDQPVHPPNVKRVLVYPSLDCLEAEEGTCNQQRLPSKHSTYIYSGPLSARQGS